MRRLVARRGKGGGHGRTAGGWIDASRLALAERGRLQSTIAEKLALELRKKPDRLSRLHLRPPEPPAQTMQSTPSVPSAPSAPATQSTPPEPQPPSPAAPALAPATASPAATAEPAASPTPVAQLRE
jgi:hypothetical protein